MGLDSMSETSFTLSFAGESVMQACKEAQMVPKAASSLAAMDMLRTDWLERLEGGRASSFFGSSFEALRVLWPGVVGWSDPEDTAEPGRSRSSEPDETSEPGCTRLPGTLKFSFASVLGCCGSPGCSADSSDCKRRRSTMLMATLPSTSEDAPLAGPYSERDLMGETGRCSCGSLTELETLDSAEKVEGVRDMLSRADAAMSPMNLNA
mmetsp:Transcript_108905/g.198356  ORF Transcript_108905/g.198356 Transcript_108905/m.198356 type:complete len:208 (-) Transcript_108905:756-1379(-)